MTEREVQEILSRSAQEQENLQRGFEALGHLFVFYLICLYVANAVLTAHLAHVKGHDRTTWVVIALIFPGLSLLAAVGLPDRGIRRDVRNGFDDLRTLGVDTRPQSYPPVKKGPFNNSGDLPAIPNIPKQ